MYQSVIIIPAYQPPHSFIGFLESLRSFTDAHILVVDDGSGAAYCERFAQATRIDGCTLLRHEVNRGKGYALRRAFCFAAERFSFSTVYITADCDGQHTPRDIVRLQAEVCRHTNSLILGCRRFDKEDIPLRSRVGNLVSARLFSHILGGYIRDTQTGLRAFSHTMLPFLLSLPGDGFDYEMHMLTECARARIPVLCMDIETRYITSKAAGEVRSHFSPFRDSFKILRVLGASVIRYSLIAVLCAVLDVLLFYVLERFVFALREDAVVVLASVVISRLVSSSVNFLLNFFFVFREKRSDSLLRYYIVWTARLLLSYGATLLWRPLCNTVLSLSIMKGLTDLLLSGITFRFLSSWVFVSSDAGTRISYI